MGPLQVGMENDRYDNYDTIRNGYEKAINMVKRGAPTRINEALCLKVFNYKL